MVKVGRCSASLSGDPHTPPERELSLPSLILRYSVSCTTAESSQSEPKSHLGLITQPEFLADFVLCTPHREQPRLLGTTENALGLRPFCKERGWELVVTSDKEGPDSVFEKEIETAE